MPKVSVIIPVYGVEKYIERCARSLFEQTLDDIEYLFIDDCTPDESIKELKRVLEEYPKRKPQVKIHRMEHNSGQAKVREWGMKNATGEYVIHCDSDDWVDSELYRKMLEATNNGVVDVVISDYVEIDEIKSIRVTCSGEPSVKKYLEKLMNGQITWALWNKLWKRTLLDNPIVWPTGNMGEDMCLCMQFLFYAKHINYVIGPAYNYFVNPCSIVRSRSEQKDIILFHQLKGNVAIVKSFYEDKPQSKSIKKGIDFISFWPYKMLAHVKQKEYKTIYNDGVSRYAKKIVMNSLLPSRERLKALTMWLGVYPYISGKQ